MRSLAGFWSAPVAGLTLVLALSGGCEGSVGAAPFVVGDAGLAGDASASWPIVPEPATGTSLPVVAARHADELCTDLDGCASSMVQGPEAAGLDTVELAVPAPRTDHVACAAATDCASGRCVRGVCTTGRAGDPCDTREQCETFCNLATHRCGDLCVDPRACR